MIKNLTEGERAWLRLFSYVRINIVLARTEGLTAIAIATAKLEKSVLLNNW